MKLSYGIVILLCILHLGQTFNLDDLLNGEFKKIALDKIFKKAGIEEDKMTPKVRKWFQDLFDRTYKYTKANNNYEDEEGLTEDLDWIQGLLENGRDLLVEWTKEDNFYYTTDNWIELAVSYAEFMLKVCPREWWTELVDIANDPNEDLSYVLVKLQEQRLKEKESELDNSNLKESINIFASLMENDDWE